MHDDARAWEQLRHVTLDRIITGIKLGGVSAAAVNGLTTPEAWPFAIVIALGRPGNHAPVAWVHELQAHLQQAAGWRANATRGGAELDTLRWMAHTVHQAHHEGAQETCHRATCAAARDALSRAEGGP